MRSRLLVERSGMIETLIKALVIIVRVFLGYVPDEEIDVIFPIIYVKLVPFKVLRYLLIV